MAKRQLQYVLLGVIIQSYFVKPGGVGFGGNWQQIGNGKHALACFMGWPQGFVLWEPKRLCCCFMGLVEKGLKVRQVTQQKCVTVVVFGTCEVLKMQVF